MLIHPHIICTKVKLSGLYLKARLKQIFEAKAGHQILHYPAIFWQTFNHFRLGTGYLPVAGRAGSLNPDDLQLSPGRDQYAKIGSTPDNCSLD